MIQGNMVLRVRMPGRDGHTRALNMPSSSCYAVCEPHCL